MSLAEYVFVDQKRLDSYVEQIKPGSAYDKVPTWKIGLSLAGPQAEAVQTRFSRTLTNQEKINALIEYLKKEELVIEGRGAEYRHWSKGRAPFRLERFKAVRTLIPKLGANTSPLPLWISHKIPELLSIDGRPTKWRRAGGLALVTGGLAYGGEYPSMLFLLEDYSEDDLTRPRILSSYSSLRMLLDESNDLATHSVLRDFANSPDHPFSRFARSPFLALRDLKAILAEEREIESLYRIRRMSMEGEIFDASGINEAERMIMFGYPIYVRAVD